MKEAVDDAAAAAEEKAAADAAAAPAAPAAVEEEEAQCLICYDILSSKVWMPFIFFWPFIYNYVSLMINERLEMNTVILASC